MWIINNLDLHVQNGERKMKNEREIANMRLHIIADNGEINLTDLIDVLTNLKLSINDYYRKNKIKNLYKESPVVKNLENGSVIIDFFVNKIPEMFIDFLKDRFSKKKYNNTNNNIIVNNNNCNVTIIEINIHNEFK